MWRNGNASDYGSEDSRFDPWQARIFLSFLFFFLDENRNNTTALPHSASFVSPSCGNSSPERRCYLYLTKNGGVEREERERERNISFFFVLEKD